MAGPNTFEPNINGVLLGNNVAGWGAIADANFRLYAAQAALGSLAIAARDMDPVSLVPTSLNVKLSAGVFKNAAGNWVTVAAVGSLALAASMTHSLWLTDAGVLTHGTSGFPHGSAIVPLAVVTTGPSTIASVVDARVPWFSLVLP